eukprot:CAMPEP_0174744660 /NCGR_PEP_ID=MMETSP1094-20130205/84942_1 /TAXON_ID=156173 /ORGANISM="Chrysochromulina brevifilum, Strain UTEX LB 985" /LENGTH=106 /DNA_ID=CAMNT_0015949087 /DNA_START=134 /DNA_END=454 /DNA_ORIENTATION=-
MHTRRGMHSLAVAYPVQRLIDAPRSPVSDVQLPQARSHLAAPLARVVCCAVTVGGGGMRQSGMRRQGKWRRGVGREERGTQGAARSVHSAVGLRHVRKRNVSWGHG